MDNHYHLMLQNSSGRMSDFFKRVNGEYGSIYRKRHGGRGYVFQNRYKSTLIQDESYLLVVLAYVLNNPVRAELCRSFIDYEWGSGKAYFLGNDSGWIEKGLVREMFQSEGHFEGFINDIDIEELPTIFTETGPVIGGEELYSEALKKFDRRKKENHREAKRKSDFYFDPLEKIYSEFEKKYKMKINELDTTNFSGKRKRAELLVRLKDLGGLTYREIIALDVFGNVKLNSLGRMYKDAKKRQKNK